MPTLMTENSRDVTLPVGTFKQPIFIAKPITAIKFPNFPLLTKKPPVMTPKPPVITPITPNGVPNTTTDTPEKDEVRITQQKRFMGMPKAIGIRVFVGGSLILLGVAAYFILRKKK